MSIRRNVFLILFLSISIPVRSQTDKIDVTSFVRIIDLTEYRGGIFRFKGFVRVDNGTKSSCARLWAKVNKKEGVAFTDLMYARPILNPLWKEYIIEGPIDKEAMTLSIGGACYGSGVCYFDTFSLEIENNGEWKNIALPNFDFEQELSQENWWTSSQKSQYIFSLVSENPFDGNRCLKIDGRSKLNFINANNISIHYKSYGKGDTLLLLHGNSESIQSFEKQIPELSKYFFVIAMDSRGQGLSTEDGRPITYELMSEDVNSFLDKLSIKNIDILGWSDGGNIGLLLGMNHPDKVRKLAIMGANLFNDETSVDPKANKILRHQKDDLINKNNPNDKFRIRMIELLLTQPNINPNDLTKIESAVLVMAGEKDVIKKSHTELIAGNIKKSKLLIFKNGTHYEPIENPDRFNKTVIEFFRER